MSAGTAARYDEYSLGGQDPNAVLDPGLLGLRAGMTVLDVDTDTQWLLRADGVFIPAGGGGGGSGFPLPSNVSAAGFLIRDLGAAALPGDAASLQVVQDEIDAALAALVIETAQIQNLAVTTGKIANGAVTTLKLAGDAVTEDKLADDAVSTDKIVNLAVTTGKLAAGAVTAAKLAVGAIVAVGAVGATTAYTGATNLSAAMEPTLTASAVLSPLFTWHPIAVAAVSQIFSLPAAAAIGDVAILWDIGPNWTTRPITVDVQGGGTIQNGDAGTGANVSLAISGQCRTFIKIGATAWALTQ